MLRSLPRLALLAVAWTVLTGGWFSGCRGLFTPVVPEPPSGNPVSDYSTPEAVLNTMTLAIAAKSAGVDAWLGAFDTTGFRHVFDENDVLVCNCTVPTTWGIRDEEEFFQNFMTKFTSEYLAAFIPVDARPDRDIDANTAVRYRKYYVQAISPTSTLTIAVGFDSLVFKRIEPNRWIISEWWDKVDPAVGVNPEDTYQFTLGRRRLNPTL